MIRFACKQCGKTFERAEDAAGSLVFCACGAPNRVPWPDESAAASPALPAVPAPGGLPRLTPVEEEAGPAPPARPPSPAPRPWYREPRRRDPARCFNHPDVSRQHTCAACGESFCDDCVVTLQGQTLCGPCKNFRVRRLQRARTVSALAIVAPILALIAGPVAVFILMMCLGAQASPNVVTIACLFGVALEGFAFLLAAFGLWKVENEPNLGGRSLAVTGLVTALVSIILTVELALLALRMLE
jgi:predicted  nucleic acid-binding Zn-ribbon protein